MRKADKNRCSLCGRELGKSFKRIVVRDAEVRSSSLQLYTLVDMDACEGCMGRFLDFQEQCRLSADE